MRTLKLINDVNCSIIAFVIIFAEGEVVAFQEVLDRFVGGQLAVVEAGLSTERGRIHRVRQGEISSITPHGSGFKIDLSWCNLLEADYGVAITTESQWMAHYMPRYSFIIPHKYLVFPLIPGCSMIAAHYTPSPLILLYEPGLSRLKPQAVQK